MAQNRQQSDQFIVVDAEDKFIGYHTREECHHNKMLIHRTMGVLIFNKQHQILLEKRSISKEMDSGKWSITGAGHVARGETYIDAAKRKLRDELGISIELRFVKKYLNVLPNETEMMTIFSGQYEGPFMLDKDEIIEVQFLNLEQLAMLANTNALSFFAYNILQNLEYIYGKSVLN